MAVENLTSINDVPNGLAELEEHLRTLSHDTQAIEIIKRFAKSLRKTSERSDLFNTEGVLVRNPIIYQDVLERGLIDANEDPFTLIQGDIVGTDTGYFLGERISGTKFMVVNSTCDLIPTRRQYAALLRIQPLKRDEPTTRQLLGELLKFNSTERMYLPPLHGDPVEVVGNAVLFDGIIQVRLEDLLLATRYASLSLVGWRIFCSLVRTIMARTGESEVAMRSSV